MDNKGSFITCDLILLSGCMTGIIPHLPGLLPFLISCLEDQKVLWFVIKLDHKLLFSIGVGEVHSLLDT